jgi:hypothetical protein
MPLSGPFSEITGENARQNAVHSAADLLQVAPDHGRWIVEHCGLALSMAGFYGGTELAIPWHATRIPWRSSRRRKFLAASALLCSRRAPFVSRRRAKVRRRFPRSEPRGRGVPRRGTAGSARARYCRRQESTIEAKRDGGMRARAPLRS